MGVRYSEGGSAVRGSVSELVEADSRESPEERGYDGVIITVDRWKVGQGRGCLKVSQRKEDRDHEQESRKVWRRRL